MSKSKEFDNILDECLERLLVRGETVEQCLQSFPMYADELKPLLETALTTRQLSSIQPRAEFRDKARYQFYAALREMEHKKSRSFFSWGWQPRWATVVAVVLALILVGGGSTVAAASGSMPDGFLYPVKLATEQVQLAFTFSDIGKAELNARLADRRVEEIVYLAGENKLEKLEQTAMRLDSSLTEIAVLSSTEELTADVEIAPEAEGEMEAEEEQEEEMVTAAATEEAAVLGEEPPTEEVPATEQELAPEKAEVSDEAPWRTVQNGNKAKLRFDRRTKLKITVEQQASTNTARLRALLWEAPESARPALRWAISISENGYKNALDALD
jgi:hypothetical protein